MDVYAWLLIVAMAAGLLGTFMPRVPGFWLIFASILVYGIFDQWMAYPIWFAVIVGILAIASSFLDYFGVMIGAKRFDVSPSASVGNHVGSVVGGFVGKKRASMVGSMVGTVAAEYKSKRSFANAMRATAGSLIGTGVVSFIQFVVGLVIFVITIVLLWGAV